jgi:rhodanese-related sulfurtransferase
MEKKGLLMKIIQILCGALVIFPGCVGIFQLPGCEKKRPVVPVDVQPIETAPDQLLEREDFDVDSQILTIDVQSVHEVLAARSPDDSSFRVVDVRGFDRYADCRVHGAINVPVKDIVEESREWDRGEKIILYTTSPVSDLAHKAARRLIAKGFNKVFVLEGGIDAWYKAKLPVDGPCRLTSQANAPTA